MPGSEPQEWGREGERAVWLAAQAETVATPAPPSPSISLLCLPLSLVDPIADTLWRLGFVRQGHEARRGSGGTGEEASEAAVVERDGLVLYLVGRGSKAASSVGRCLSLSPTAEEAAASLPLFVRGPSASPFLDWSSLPPGFVLLPDNRTVMVHVLPGKERLEVHL